LFDAHAPYEPHGLPGFSQNGTPGKPSIDHRARLDSSAPYTAAEREQLRALYREEVTFTDGQVGELLQIVDRKVPGALVVVVGDHGEMLGEAGIDFAHYGLHEPVVRVPMMVRFPDGFSGRVPEQVRVMDVAPTLLAYAHVPFDAEGMDLRAFAASERREALPVTLVGRRARDFSQGAAIGWRSGELKAVRDLGHREIAPREEFAGASPAIRAAAEAALAKDEVLFRQALEREGITLPASETRMLEALGYHE
jgi:arylsulfatase A-like enzyme